MAGSGQKMVCKFKEAVKCPPVRRLNAAWSFELQKLFATSEMFCCSAILELSEILSDFIGFQMETSMKLSLQFGFSSAGASGFLPADEEHLGPFTNFSRPKWMLKNWTQIFFGGDIHFQFAFFVSSPTGLGRFLGLLIHLNRRISCTAHLPLISRLPVQAGGRFSDAEKKDE